MTLEQNLRHSAEKKGLSGEEEEHYVGGAIENMRKQGKLPNYGFRRGKSSKLKPGPTHATEAAKKFIRETEKKYKSEKKRKEVVGNRARSNSDIWRSLGLQNDPDHKEAMRIYREYIE